MISDIPFYNPVSAVRLGMINDEFIINPTYEQISESDLDLIVAGTKKDLVMIEGGANQLSEETLIKALEKAHEQIIRLCEFQEQIRKEYFWRSRLRRNYQADSGGESYLKKWDHISLAIYCRLLRIAREN